MNNEITLKLTNDDVIRLLLATTSIRFDFEREADEATNEKLRMDKERSAAVWKRIHDDIRAQRNLQQNAD